MAYSHTGIRIGNMDRRRVQRGHSPAHPPRPLLIARIVGSYREMPGLCLRLEQAARLFGISQRTAEIILSDLVDVGTLRLTADGQYAHRA